VVRNTAELLHAYFAYISKLRQATLVIRTRSNIAEVQYFSRNWIKQSFPPELAGADTCRLYKCLKQAIVLLAAILYW